MGVYNFLTWGQQQLTSTCNYAYMLPLVISVAATSEANPAIRTTQSDLN